MKARFLCLALLPATLFSTGADAAVYDHCQKFVQNRWSGFSAISANIDAGGKLGFSQASSKHAYSVKNGVHTFSKKADHDPGITYVTEFETKDGRLKKVTELELTKDGMRDEKRVIRFEEKNGVCYPAEMASENNHPQWKDGQWLPKPRKVNKLEWNTTMCREITEYLEKNPGALDCRCGSDSTNKSLALILKKHDPYYQPADGKPLNLGKDPLTEEGQSGMEKVIGKLSDPLSRAIDFVKTCGNYQLAEAVHDSRIWKSAPASPDERGEAKKTNSAE